MAHVLMKKNNFELWHVFLINAESAWKAEKTVLNTITSNDKSRSRIKMNENYL